MSASTPASTQISSAPVSLGEHGDRAAAGQERREHLRGDLARVGADALGRDAVVGGRDDDPGLDLRAWLRRSRPASQIASSSRRPRLPGRLDELGLARARGGHGGFVERLDLDSHGSRMHGGPVCSGASSREGAGKPVRDRRGRATVIGTSDPGSQETDLRGPTPTGRVIPRRFLAPAPHIAELPLAVTRRLLLVRHASTGRGARRRVRGRRAAGRAGVAARGASGGAAAAARRGAGLAGAARGRDRALRADRVAVDRRWPSATSARWAGRPLTRDRGRTTRRVRAWMTDPDAAPHGGESSTALLARVRAWLDEQAALDGTAIAITHGGVVKAAVVAALDAPPSAFWRIDVAPLSITELHAHDGRWTVTRVNDRVREAARRAARRLAGGSRVSRARGGTRRRAVRRPAARCIPSPGSGSRAARVRARRLPADAARRRGLRGGARRRRGRARARCSSACCRGAAFARVCAVGRARRAVARARGGGRRPSSSSARRPRRRRGVRIRSLVGRDPERARRDRAVARGDRVGRREHGRRGGRAAVLGRGRGRAGRARAPRGQHARRDGRPPQRALRAVRHGGGARRRRRELARRAARRRALDASLLRAGRAARRTLARRWRDDAPRSTRARTPGVIEAAFAGALGLRARRHARLRAAASSTGRSWATARAPGPGRRRAARSGSPPRRIAALADRGR